MTPIEWLEANPEKTMNDYYEWKRQQGNLNKTSKTESTYTNTSKSKNSNLSFLLRLAGFLILVVVGTLIFKNYQNNQRANSTYLDYSVETPQKPKTEAELKQDLKSVEISNPTKHLYETNGLYRTRIIKKEIVLTGTFNNNATLATFYDIAARVDFFSKTGTNMGTETYTFYEKIPPGKKVNFNKTVEIPNHISKKDLKSVTFEILSAKGY